MASLILNRGQFSVNIKEFIASSAEDMNTISLTNVAPGSKCLCLDTFDEYILDTDGSWKIMPAQSNGANVDLTGYATEEWVNAKIALILENPTIDIDSIAELAKVLEEGGADLAELRQIIDTLTSKVELLAQTDKTLSQAVTSESIAREEADAELRIAIEETNASLTENVEAINKKIQAEVDNNAMVHNMSAQVDAKLMDDIHAVEQDILKIDEVLSVHNQIIDDIKLGEAMYRAQEMGPVDNDDRSYSIKNTDDGLEFTNYKDEVLTKVTISNDGIPVEQRYSVIKSTVYPVGEKFSTIVTDPDNVFQSVEEIKTDVEKGGNKFQRLWEEGILASGYEGYYCNEITHRKGNDLYIILDDAGDGFVGLEAGTTISDITYTENVMKIVKIGDFYLYVVYDENHRPIGACKIGRPRGYFPEGDKNYNAEFIFTELYDDDVSGGDGKLDPSKTIYEAINTFPAARAPRDKVPFVTSNGTSIEGEITGTIAWGTPVHKFKLITVNGRYYFVYSSRHGEPAGWCCPEVKNKKFQLYTSSSDWNTITDYEFADDFFTIKQIEETVTSASIHKYDLLKTLEGKGTLVSNIDEYAIPYSNVNLWGGYWPEKDDYRVGIFNPNSDNYEYGDNNGTNVAYELNPAGNYAIGKLESFHPLRMQDGSEQKIRVATVKGFKTTMDWPNAAAVIPSDCSLKSGAIWFQLIFAHTVSNEFKVFYRVLYDGYVKGKDGVRYPWSPCAEIVTTKQLQEVLNKITELEAACGEIEQLAKSIEKVSAKADENYQKSVAYTDNVKAGLDLRINEGFAKVSADMAEIKTPLYFGEYTNDEELIALSDVIKYFRKSNRGAIIERIYIHMWLDDFDDDLEPYGFDLIYNNNSEKIENITEAKGLYYVDANGLVPNKENKTKGKQYKVTQNTGSNDGIMTVGANDSEMLVTSDAFYNTTVANLADVYIKPCKGLVIDIPEFRMNTITTIGNYEVDNAEDFTKAILNAGAGATITVNNDITLASNAAAALVIDKPITIRGNGNTKITTDTNTKLFEVYADLTIEGVNLENTVRGGRCVDTRVDNITVTLKDCTISCLEISAQPITVGGASTNGLNINIDNCQIDGGTGYGIIVFVPVNMNITNSNVHGYAAIYTKAGSEGSIINVNGSNLSSTGVNDGSEFATVVTEGNNVIVAIDEVSTISCEGELQYLTIANYLSANTLKVQGTALKTQFEEAGFVTETSGDWHIVKKMPAADFTAPNEFTLHRTNASGNEYVGNISGSYFPKDATMNFEVIITDESIGDGGDFYRITDPLVTNGHYELYVRNAPSAAGIAHPSAVKITLTAGDEVVEKILPIVLE